MRGRLADNTKRRSRCLGRERQIDGRKSQKSRALKSVFINIGLISSQGEINRAARIEYLQLKAHEHIACG